MKIEALLMDAEDVQVTQSVNPQTQRTEAKCRFKLMTSKPTAVIDVSLTPDQIQTGAIQAVQACAGKKLMWEIEFRNSSFGDEKTNMHRSFTGFRLFSVPELAKG